MKFVDVLGVTFFLILGAGAMGLAVLSSYWWFLAVIALWVFAAFGLRQS